MSIHEMTLGLTAAAGISKKDIFREHNSNNTNSANQQPTSDKRQLLRYGKASKNLMEYQQELMNKEIQERTYEAACDFCICFRFFSTELFVFFFSFDCSSDC
jgi:hypothetical protein